LFSVKPSCDVTKLMLCSGPRLVRVEVRTAEAAVGEGQHGAVVRLDEPSDVVAESAVPLLPRVAGEAADLVEPGRVPGFGDELGPGQDRIRLDVPEDGGTLQRTAGLVARQHGREVEPEAVDVHVGDPVAQAVEDEAAHHRVVRVQRVAGPRVVRVSGAIGVEE
jgi:hypothetical protein